MAKIKRLTGKAERFCLEYLIDYHPEKAALRAGYKPAGTRKDRNAGARGNAHRLLKDLRVINQISKLKQAQLPDISRKWLESELFEIITDRNIPPSTRVNAIREMAKVTGAYEGDDLVPDTINLILRRGTREDDDGDNDGDTSEQVAEPPTGS